MITTLRSSGRGSRSNALLLSPADFGTTKFLSFGCSAITAIGASVLMLKIRYAAAWLRYSIAYPATSGPTSLEGERPGERGLKVLARSSRGPHAPARFCTETL